MKDTEIFNNEDEFDLDSLEFKSFEYFDRDSDEPEELEFTYN